MSLVTVAGIDIGVPSKYNALQAEIVDSGRNIQGYVVSDVIRYNVAKIEMTWNYLTVAEWSRILKIFNPEFGGAFVNTVKYFDQCAGEFVEKRMYVSDRTSGLVSLDSSGNPRGWSDCKLSLVEV